MLALRGMLQHQGQLFIEKMPVGQIRDGVVISQFVQLFFGQFALRKLVFKARPKPITRTAAIRKRVRLDGPEAPGGQEAPDGSEAPAVPVVPEVPGASS